MKNILELPHHYPKKFPDNDYTRKLIDIRNRMSHILKDSLNVFNTGDVKKAKR